MLTLQAKKLEWADLCEQLKGFDKASTASAERWQQRAKVRAWSALKPV